MSAVELTVLPVSDQCKGLLGIDSMFWWRLRSKCSPDAPPLPTVPGLSLWAPNPLGNIFDDDRNCTGKMRGFLGEPGDPDSSKQSTQPDLTCITDSPIHNR